MFLAVVVTWPLVVDPTGSLLGHPDVDVWNHAWGPWWWARSLGAGELPWHTTLLRAPLGGSLWFIDPLLAIFGAPLVGSLGVVATWNLALFASVLLTSVGTGKFVRALGGSGVGPWVGSAAAASATAVTCALHNGISESLHLGPVALAFAAVEVAARRPGRARWLLAGAAVGLTALVSPYYGLGAAVVSLVRAGAARSRQALWALPALLMTAVPAVAGLALQLDAEDAIVRRPEAMNTALALHNAVDPRAFAVPGFVSVALDGEGFVHLGYLGLVTLVLAGAAWRSEGARSWWIGAGAGLLLALGPWLYWGGDWLTIAGTRIPLPWLLLQGGGPASTHSLRLAAPVAIALAGLAGVGAGRLGRWALLLPPLVLLDNLSAAPWPIATSPSAIPSVYAELPPPAAAGGDGILDLPTDLGATMGTSRYLYWQTTHGHPIPYIPDARASTSSLSTDPLFQVLAARCRRRADEDERLHFERVPLRIVEARSLREQGIRWVVLHGDLDPAVTRQLLPLLERFFGQGVAHGPDRRWDLAPAVTPSP